MKKEILAPALVLAGIVFCFGLGLAQEDIETLDNRAFSKISMPPAVFAHDAHNEKAGLDDCAVCHHVIENGRPSESETSEDQACVECHAVARAGDNPIPLRRAYHLRCKGCHLASEAGPIMCAGCHSRGPGG